MLIATVLVVLGAWGRRFRNGRRPGGGRAERVSGHPVGFRGWRNVPVAISAAVLSCGGVATAAVAWC
ncbi:MAG: hypothetical protein HOQ44_16735 [Nocardia sp.]|nr:hypothetical protein [Nocardia sp.]